MVSDWGGLIQGFRYGNDWLVGLTGNVFSEGFYMGNAVGSFNSMMWLLTGLLGWLGIAWTLYPLLGDAFRDLAERSVRGVSVPKPSVTVQHGPHHR